MRYVLEVMYDGTQFHGSQLQGDTPTVQLALNTALATLLRTPAFTFGASRTDEGVHALSNFYHFDTNAVLTQEFVYKCNAVLPHSLAVRRIHIASHPDFNARFHATSRRYRYRIYFRKNPFLNSRAYYYPFRLDRQRLSDTAAIIREYDHFEAFSKRSAQTKTYGCTIYQSYWEDKEGMLEYVVEANRFLRGMVRGLVGTQLHIARGSNTTAQFRAVMESRDCRNAKFDVPGCGLYLEEIRYKDEAFAGFIE